MKLLPPPLARVLLVACSLVATPTFLTGGDFVASDSDRLSEIFFNIAESEYEIRWQDRVGSYQSPNRAQNLRFSYFDDGFVAQRRVQTDGADEWMVALRLDRFGKVTATRTLDVGEMTIDRKSAIVAHDGIEIHYHNDVEGMRQNFLVDGSPGEGELRLEMVAVLDGVEMGVSERGDFVYFENAVEEVMRYSDLNVWDARGEPLAAWFEAIDKERFAIVVADADAEYPVFIDPLSSYWGTSGNQGNADFGFSVVYGEFTTDVGDVAVGAPYYDEGQNNEGKVFMYDGLPSGFPPSPSWSAQGDTTDGQFGYALAAGDVNGDGYDDLIVGAPTWDDINAGAVFVWFGSETGFGDNGTPSNMDWFKKAGAGFGTSVAVGNFNGDISPPPYLEPMQDLIVGAPYENNSGKVYLYQGSPSGPSSSPTWSAACGVSGANFGWSVASAGNVNNTYHDDIIVGAKNFTNGQTGEGAAFIWHSAAAGLSPNPGTGSNMARRLEGNVASAQFGYSVAGGNVNGDAFSDVAVGAPLYGNPQANEGKVFVYHGSTNGVPANANWSMESNQAGAQFGFSVALQDLNYNPDQIADLIVGAPFFDWVPLTIDGGGTYVFYGVQTTGLNTFAGWSYFHIRSNARSGWSVAGGRNLKYTSHPGVIIGAPRDDFGLGVPKGSIVVFVNQ